MKNSNSTSRAKHPPIHPIAKSEGLLRAKDKKESEIKDMEQSLRAIGINRVVVVLWSDQNFDISKRKRGYEIAGEIISRLDENNRFINTVII